MFDFDNISNDILWIISIISTIDQFLKFNIFYLKYYCISVYSENIKNKEVYIYIYIFLHKILFNTEFHNSFTSAKSSNSAYKLEKNSIY